MSASHKRIILAGIAGGMAMNITMLLTFRLLGFGWNGGGILLEASSQSEKLIAVWTKLEPLPLVVNTPAPIIIGIILFGIFHAYLFNWISPVLPKGIFNAGIKFGLMLFVMVFLFWEFFTPFNMFDEPLHLIALELAFWACIAIADGLAISFLLRNNVKN